MMNLKRSIYLPGNQLLNYISGRFNFDERRYLTAQCSYNQFFLTSHNISYVNLNRYMKHNSLNKTPLFQL